jgi:hypothetical protein
MAGHLESPLQIPHTVYSDCFMILPLISQSRLEFEVYSFVVTDCLGCEIEVLCYGWRTTCTS